jgi:activator-of-BECN1-regulated-autophagy protein 1
MELVRVLPSAGDEVNVACFHPSPGAGLVYGTKVTKKSYQLQKGNDL